jgi:hypothetical protein
VCPGIAGLQAAVDAPDKVRGVQLLDISLRMLHTTKQQPWQRPLVSTFQRLLRETQLGQWFFKAVAKPQVLISIMAACALRRLSCSVAWVLLYAEKHSCERYSVAGLAQNVKSILQECYGDPAAVTEELVELILKPGLEV